MGFQKPDLESARWAISRTIGEICSPYNDGWTASACKHDLYLLKCWLEDRYELLPRFSDEEKWEQERLVQKLKE